MKNVVFHCEAEEEMVASAEYYDSKSVGLGIKFLDEVEEKTGKGVIVDRSPLSEIVYNDELSKVDRYILLKMIKEKDHILILDRTYEKYLLYSSLKSKRDEFDILSEKKFSEIQRKFLSFAVPGSNVHWC